MPSQLHRSTAPALHFEKISVDFGSKRLFSALSFQLPAGACTCLLGPSGCGKSTLLKLAAGDPKISYRGKVFCTPQAGNIGWMSQNDLLLPWLNLRDNVMLGARLRGKGTPEIREKANKLLSRAGLENAADLLPGALSGGMRQRGALLRTLIEDANLLLMDEPFSALDALTRFTLQELTATLTCEKTVFLVTHDPLEAVRMADQIIVLSDTGRIAKIFSDLPGTPPRPPGIPSCTEIETELLDILLHTSRKESAG